MKMSFDICLIILNSIYYEYYIDVSKLTNKFLFEIKRKKIERIPGSLAIRAPSTDLIRHQKQGKLGKKT